jgi:hypothetical protein
MKTKNTFRDLYKFPGFRARSTLKSHTGDPEGWIVILERRQKKRSVPAAVKQCRDSGIGELIWCETWTPEQTACILNSNIAGLPALIATP